MKRLAVVRLSCNAASLVLVSPAVELSALTMWKQCRPQGRTMEGSPFPNEANTLKRTCSCQLSPLLQEYKLQVQASKTYFEQDYQGHFIFTRSKIPKTVMIASQQGSIYIRVNNFLRSSLKSSMLTTRSNLSSVDAQPPFHTRCGSGHFRRTTMMRSDPFRVSVDLNKVLWISQFVWFRREGSHQFVSW